METLEDRVSAHYGDLSAQLRKAADYVVSNPLDVASRSLRRISDDSDVSIATYSRLARALGFQTFEEMKDVSRSAVGQQSISFSEKAQQLQSTDQTKKNILSRQSEACVQNIHALVQKTDLEKLNAASQCLGRAKRVLLFGALGSTGIVEYMAYLAQYFAPNWSLAGRMGGSLGSAILDLGPGDAVLIVTKTPYVGRAVTTAKLASEAGAEVILITDLHQCPALAHATFSFIVPSESPQFFSSYVATLMLIETLIAMIVASSNKDTAASIKKVEDSNRALGEFWAE